MRKRKKAIDHAAMHREMNKPLDLSNRTYDGKGPVRIAEGIHRLCLSCDGSGLDGEVVCNACSGFGVLLSDHGVAERARLKRWEDVKKMFDIDEDKIGREAEAEWAKELESNDQEREHEIVFDQNGVFRGDGTGILPNDPERGSRRRRRR